MHRLGTLSRETIPPYPPTNFFAPGHLLEASYVMDGIRGSRRYVSVVGVHCKIGKFKQADQPFMYFVSLSYGVVHLDFSPQFEIFSELMDRCQ